MAEAITATVSPALEHIIERPRLIARLEAEGGSRVTVLAAPAGYGKTTLARQWSERQTGPVAWYRTTRASGDVALLAVQLDELLASIAPELPREPRRVASIASVNPSPEPLGRAIVRTFASLGRDVLCVVDEWEAAGTDEAEELLSTLVDRLDIRSGPLAAIGALNLNSVGYAIVGLFALTWAVAGLVWRFGRIEQRWAPEEI